MILKLKVTKEVFEDAKNMIAVALTTGKVDKTFLSKYNIPPNAKLKAMYQDSNGDAGLEFDIPMWTENAKVD